MNRIVFVGDLNSYGRSYQRLRAMRDLGYSVIGISYSRQDFVPGIGGEPGVWSKILTKIGFPLDEAGVNTVIVSAVRDPQIHLLWIEKGLTIRPFVLKAAKAINRGIRIVSYSEDDMFMTHNQSAYYRRCLPLYDVVFTTKSYNVRPAELPALGALRTVFVGKAYDPHMHRPIALSPGDRERFGDDVQFIGTFEDDRAQKMLYLAKNGIRIRVWGNGWQHWMKMHTNLIVEGKPLYGDDYVRALCASKINLCFLRKVNRDLQTDRTMEIPACGVFMLAERTEEHLALFEEGKEAEFFDDEGELLSKVRFYLDHDQQREAIAAEGRQRCLRSGYSHHERLKFMLSEVFGRSALTREATVERG